MRNKTGIIESLIEKRREQEEIIAKQLAEDEKQEKESHELESSLESRLELLKEEEKAIRNKDANRYNSIRCDFLGTELFPELPQKEHREIVEVEVEVETEAKSKAKAKAKAKTKAKAKANANAKAKAEKIEPSVEPALKDCIKGAPMWFMLFGGIIGLAGVQTLVFQMVEGGIRNAIVWLIIGLGLALLVAGSAIAWMRRARFMKLNKPASSDSDSGSDSEPDSNSDKDRKATKSTKEVIVENKNFPAEYNAYKQKVFALYKENLRKQSELSKQKEQAEKAEQTSHKDTEAVTEAKTMMEKIDHILYLGLLPVANPGWDSKDLEKILKVVKSGKVDDFEEACKFYMQYQKQHSK